MTKTQEKDPLPGFGGMGAGSLVTYSGDYYDR
jgi:hypothetical protein